MEINDQLVDELAQLAKLEFKNEEKQAIKKDLNEILQFMDKLNELDTTGVEPLIFMTEETNVLGKDEVNQEISHEDALKNAPDSEGGHFRVPRVVGKSNG